MPKKRLKDHEGLPLRWRIKGNSYYYRVPIGDEHIWDGKTEFKLGNTMPEAYKTWAKRIETFAGMDRIKDILDRYMIEVVPTKSPTTQKSNHYEVKYIYKAFGHMQPVSIKPKHIYQYAAARKKKTSAKREIALLSHALTKAVEWGLIDKHPFKGQVRIEGNKPRTRYIEDWEIIECLKIPPTGKTDNVLIIQSYMRLKLLTGLRRGDILRLRMEDRGKDGLRVETSKTGRAVVYEYTPEFTAVLDEVKSLRPVDISPHMFCNRRGEPFIKDDGSCHTWNTMWVRFMNRVLTETNVIDRFTEHDLRAKCASDAKSLEHARQLLAHADSNITQRVYRRKAEIVKPLR